MHGEPFILENTEQLKNISESGTSFEFFSEKSWDKSGDGIYGLLYTISIKLDRIIELMQKENGKE